MISGNTEVLPADRRLAPDEPVPKSATILVLDDQKYVRHTLHSLLAQQSHWKIYEAENGRVALDRIREIHPYVVVLDIALPRMNKLRLQSISFKIALFVGQTAAALRFIVVIFRCERIACRLRLFFPRRPTNVCSKPVDSR